MHDRLLNDFEGAKRREIVQDCLNVQLHASGLNPYIMQWRHP